MKPRPNAASITIYAPGDGAVPVRRQGPAGFRRRRDSAVLTHVKADAQYWHETFQADDTASGHHILLEQPDRAALLEAVDNAAAHLITFGPQKGQLDFAFAGHATKEGLLLLGGGEQIRMTEVITRFIDAPGVDWRPFLTITLDCCFAARVLADAFCHAGNSERFAIIDAFAASLHDESAWELDNLGHGVLTYTKRHPGNAHVDPAELSRSVRDNDQEAIRSALHGLVPNPITYLTEGDQSSVDLINNHFLQVDGAGSVDILRDVDVGEFLALLEWARSADLGETIEVSGEISKQITKPGVSLSSMKIEFKNTRLPRSLFEKLLLEEAKLMDLDIAIDPIDVRKKSPVAGWSKRSDGAIEVATHIVTITAGVATTTGSLLTLVERIKKKVEDKRQAEVHYGHEDGYR